MQRRAILSTAAIAALAVLDGKQPAEAAAPELVSSPGWRRFEITTSITLLDSPGPAQLWVPVAQTAAGYQSAAGLQWRGTGRTEFVRDAQYGAGMLRSVWEGGAAAQQLEVVQVVATRDRGSLPFVPLTRAEREFWSAPTESVPLDGIVRETALRIVDGRTSQRARLQAIYDWVVDNTWRNPETPGCGTGDFKSMLQNGNFGGKCADINGLAVGLARAAGFPARDVYGIRVADAGLHPSLGRSGDISKAQHCRAEVFLDEEGWFPIDPADVRKVILEEKLAIDSPEVRALRDRLFGQWEMNWIGYNSANDIELPGARQQRSNFAFLMYPCAFTSTGQPDCLDPSRFHYEISSRELNA